MLQEHDAKVKFRDGVLTSSKQRCQLTTGELTITYYGHACVIIKCGDFQLATDPWLVGDCFIGGWYPLHGIVPPMYWAEDLARVDMIYISHRHPDHYHPETLRHVSKLNPTIPIFVAQLSNGSVIDSYLPFDNVVRQKLGTWYRKNEDFRISL